MGARWWAFLSSTVIATLVFDASLLGEAGPRNQEESGVRISSSSEKAPSVQRVRNPAHPQVMRHRLRRCGRSLQRYTCVVVTTSQLKEEGHVQTLR